MQTRRTLTSNTKNTHIQMTKVPTKWTKTQQLKIENWYKLLTSYEKLFYFAGCQPKSHCSMKSLEINNHKGKTKLKDQSPVVGKNIIFFACSPYFFNESL